MAKIIIPDQTSQRRSAGRSALPVEQSPLLTNIHGSTAYKENLSAAAHDLLKELTQDSALQGVSGTSINIPDHDGSRLIPYGHLPEIGRAKEALWIPALECLLHALAHAASTTSKGIVSVSVPYGKGRSLRVFTRASGINGAAFKGAIACLVKTGWIELFPAKDGNQPYVRSCLKLEDWMMCKGLVFEGHPNMPLHS